MMMMILLKNYNSGFGKMDLNEIQEIPHILMEQPAYYKLIKCEAMTFKPSSLFSKPFFHFCATKLHCSSKYQNRWKHLLNT